MDRKQRQLVLLGVLGLLLVVLVVFRIWPALSPAGRATQVPPPARQAPAAGSGRRAASAPTSANEPPRVALEALERRAPEPLDTRRNPFGFEAEAPPPPPAVTAPPPGPAENAGTAEGGGTGTNPMGSSRPPPIPLKFIGVVTESPSKGKLAVLSDGKFVYHGREGDIIDGRYRIVRIGEESIQIEHADGRGRQTIRLTGS